MITIDPARFVPQYDDSIVEYYILQPGNAWAVNERYCLQPTCAKILASLFVSRPAVVLLPPINQGGPSPFTFNRNVPWLKFADGTVRNAGQLATYWGMPGVPLSEALHYAQIDVDTKTYLDPGYDGL